MVVDTYKIGFKCWFLSFESESDSKESSTECVDSKSKLDYNNLQVSVVLSVFLWFANTSNDIMGCKIQIR